MYRRPPCRVGRASIAEKTQWQHAVCVSLTYDDNAPGGYDAARFFAYGDVRAFVQRVTAALRRINKSLAVRFICAGEQGDRYGRCHWHLVLYSDYDLRQLGTVRFCSADLPCYQDGKRLRWGDVITDPEAMMTVGKDKRRLHWSLWAVDKQPLGFVSFGSADEAGISYVLSYCLKDQFTYERSQGTAREAKSENFATGLFRMSKRPAIGEAWLMQNFRTWTILGPSSPTRTSRCRACPVTGIRQARCGRSFYGACARSISAAFGPDRAKARNGPDCSTLAKTTPRIWRY